MSPWLHWGLVAGYLVGYVLCWRTTAWIIAHDMVYKPSGEDVVVGIVVGAVLSFFWPILVPGRWLYVHGLFTGENGAKLMRPPKAERERALQAKIEERERRIAELEREVGIQ